MLRLLLQKGEYLQEIVEVPIPNAEKLDIVFSPDGRYLVMLKELTNQISIYKIENYNIENFVKSFVNGIEPLIEYDGWKEFEGCNKMEFSQNSRFLAINGTD